MQVVHVVCLDGVPSFEINEPLLDGACLVLSRVGDFASDLRPEESAALGEVSDVRSLQFSSGRRAAHRAIAQLQVEDRAIGRNERLPVWPPGTQGSISHSDTLAGAAIGPSETYLGIGIDLVPISAVSDKVAQRLLLEPELKWVREMGSGDWRTALFSAKESVYKAVNPVVGEYLGFRDVTVSVVPDALEFFAATLESRESSEIVDAGHGFIHRVEGHWLTVFVVRQKSAETMQTRS